ncbi:MAG: hypothetical protein ACJ74Z_09040 [Bryobacteraceae bacterium]
MSIRLHKSFTSLPDTSDVIFASNARGFLAVEHGGAAWRPAGKGSSTLLTAPVLGVLRR